MAFIYSPQVKSKLARRHNVTLDEVRECFTNRSSGCLEDNREDHESDPPHNGLLLKQIMEEN